MNAKNIISAILMVLSFAACTSEIEGIDDNMMNTNTTVNNNGETSISVRMMAEGTATKADSQSDESAIRNYVIAVFEEKSNERVGYVSETVEGGHVETSTVNGINTKAGTVKVIVVANVDQVSEFNNLYTYEEFSAKTVGNLKNLTKVGVKENVILSKENHELNVELKQLTARVNVILNAPKVVGGNGVTVDFKAYSYSASIADNSSVISVPRKGDVKKMNLNLDGETSISYITYAVKEPKLTVNTKLVIYVNGEVAKTIEKEISVEFSQGKTLDVLLAGKSYNLQVDANVTVTQNFDVDFGYEIAQIKDNTEQEITYE